MLKKILTKCIIMFDTLYKRLYPKDKNKIAMWIVNDYSNEHKEINLTDFVEARGYESLKELYIIINDYYNLKLSELIVEGNDIEISKLKYLKIILFDIKQTLINNSKPNG